MKRIFKRLIPIAALMMALIPSYALATELTASADKTAVEIEDVVTVTITVKGEELSIASGVFTYDPAILAFSEGEGGVSDGFVNMISAEKDGSDSLSAKATFTAVAAGEAKIDFTLEKVMNYDGDSEDTATASVTVTVNAAPAAPETPKEPISYAKEGIEAVNVSGAEEKMYVWKNLENVTIPSRYSITTLTYHGAEIQAVEVQDSDAPTLLYLSNDSGETGGYYIYNQEADTLYPYRTLNSVSKSYILMPPDGSVPVPEGFAETTITISEKPIAAWSKSDAQGEVYLVYARNPDGETGYYTYNFEDESLQRYAVMPARPVQPTVEGESAPSAPVPAEPTSDAQEEPEKEGISLPAPVLIAAAVLILLLIAAIVVLLVMRAQERARRRRRAQQRREKREREMGQ